MIKEIKLLNHQYELLADTTTKILGMSSGYGGGKTYAACRKAIQLATLNAGFTGIITEPTYPMLRDIFVPEMKSALEEWGIPYKFNMSSSIFLLDINGIETKILCMSMENVERLVGVNAAFILCDEFDTTKKELALKAYNKLLGRLRSGNIRQLVICSTPEGFSAMHQIFISDHNDSKRLIRAKTTDNKYLPEDFIDTLRAQYPENLLRAYLDGEFINLTSGTVYSYFKRNLHNCDWTPKKGETLHIGQDFNVGGCVSKIFIIRDDIPALVDELISYDTMGVCDTLRDKYPTYHIIMYPDASGSQRSTNAARSDIQILKDAGFNVQVAHSNPLVKDRVNAVNAAFSHNRLLVNVNTCPKSVEALEQQAYDSNGAPEKFGGAGTVDDHNDAFGYFIVKKYGIIKTNISVSQRSFT